MVYCLRLLVDCQCFFTKEILQNAEKLTKLQMPLSDHTTQDFFLHVLILLQNLILMFFVLHKHSLKVESVST